MKNEVGKNRKFNTLKTEVNNLDKKIPDATTLIHINQYNRDKKNLEKKMEMLIKKIADVSGLVTTTVLNTKISEVENKIPDTSSLVTKTVLNIKVGEVENKIPNQDAYITTQEFNKLTAENVNEKLEKADLVSKNDFDNKLISFNKKITSNKIKCLEVPKILNSLTTKDYKLFLICRIYISDMYFINDDGSQYMFVYQPTLDTLELEKDNGSDYVLSWKSKGVYTSNIKPLYTVFFHSIKLYGCRMGIELD